MKLPQKDKLEVKERTSCCNSLFFDKKSHLRHHHHHRLQECFCVKRMRRRRHLFLHESFVDQRLSPSSVIVPSYSSSSRLSMTMMVFHCLLIWILLICSCHASSPSSSTHSPTSLFASSSSNKANSPPKFTTDPNGPGSEIVVVVKEGPESVGRELLRISGEDADGDDLTFGIQSSSFGSDLVNISNNVPTRNSAIVFLIKELDREKKDSYNVVLTLTDGKLGRDKFVTKTMLIVVLDVNDNDPVFRPFRPILSFPENYRPQVIESVEAYDLDEGRFGQVLYRLQEVDKRQGPDTFKIETIEGKGVISLAGHLDYEKKSVYNLRILAIVSIKLYSVHSILSS